MSENYEILTTHLTNFAALAEKDIADSRAFWKSRKMKKGEFFNMQSMACNDLGLIVEGIFRIHYSNPERMEELLFFSPEQRYVRLLDDHPNIVNRIAAYHIASFLGITNPSLSRIRKRIKR